MSAATAPVRAPDLLALARTGPVHFMGIGGAGMCALAELVVRDGGQVTGCDANPGAAARRLVDLGATVHTGHDAAHVDDAVAVVVTAAVAPDHPELVHARARGIPVVKRAAALASLVDRGRVVAIAGTHGKTGTTALTVRLLEEAGLDPTGFVGGTVAAWGGNLRAGSPDLAVVEADEYDRSFLHLTPDVAVVTNVEADHLEIYGDEAGVRDAFATFLAGCRPDALVVLCADDPGAASLAAAVPTLALTYGTSAGSRLRAVDVQPSAEGTRFRIMEDGVDRGSALVAIPGLHSLRNALAGAAVARHLGADWGAIVRGLADWRGVGRRFERLGAPAGIEVIDDYAHHPTEIAATLAAAREAFPGRRLVAVFQPHLYSRTRDFAGDFGRALAAADMVWLTGIFPAREAPIPGVDVSLVADAVRVAGRDPRVHEDLGSLATAVAGEVRAGDVVVAMGAGSIERIGPELVSLLAQHGGDHA